MNKFENKSRALNANWKRPFGEKALTEVAHIDSSVQVDLTLAPSTEGGKLVRLLQTYSDVTHAGGGGHWALT